MIILNKHQVLYILRGKPKYPELCCKNGVIFCKNFRGKKCFLFDYDKRTFFKLLTISLKILFFFILTTFTQITSRPLLNSNNA